MIVVDFNMPTCCETCKLKKICDVYYFCNYNYIVEHGLNKNKRHPRCPIKMEVEIEK